MGVLEFLEESMLAQFQYPLEVSILGGNTVEINSDDELKAIINANLNNCE